MTILTSLPSLQWRSLAHSIHLQPYSLWRASADTDDRVSYSFPHQSLLHFSRERLSVFHLWLAIRKTLNIKHKWNIAHTVRRTNEFASVYYRTDMICIKWSWLLIHQNPDVTYRRHLISMQILDLSPNILRPVFLQLNSRDSTELHSFKGLLPDGVRQKFK